MSSLAVSAVVPTIGKSPLFEPALQALRAQRGAELEIIVVASGPTPPHPSPLAARWVRYDEPLSFSAATNLGIAGASGELIATVNDDVVAAEGWLETLIKALAEHPQAAAAQGVNIRPGEPPEIDGCGLVWNDSWQSVQWLGGEPHDAAPKTPREIFGVSATAALFRRRALEELTDQANGAFDEDLGSYYEDVDLACRLRAAGWSSWLIPTARATHAGSLSGDATGARIALIHRNRLLVLARLLGSSLWTRLPRILLRDVLDVGVELRSGKPHIAADVARGVLSAIWRLPRFSRRGAPLLLLSQLSRFRVSS